MTTNGLKGEEQRLELPTTGTTPEPPPPAAAAAAGAFPEVPPLTYKPGAPPLEAPVKPVADGIATVRIPPQAQNATAAAPAPGGQEKVVVYINHPADLDNPNRCACTTGWLLFGLGWAFWPLWFAGAMLPLCDKREHPTVRANNRRAAIGSIVMAVVSVALIIIIVVTAVTAGQTVYRSYYDDYLRSYPYTSYYDVTRPR